MQVSEYQGLPLRSWNHPPSHPPGFPESPWPGQGRATMSDPPSPVGSLHPLLPGSGPRASLTQCPCPQLPAPSSLDAR